jgi:ligand-binding sensor domain-containing protein
MAPPPHVRAAPDDRPSNLQVWGRGDGLPVNAVISLAQSRQGDLWIGTANGLARFDGQKFETLSHRSTPALRHDDIEALAEDESGALWIGTLGGLSVMRDGVVTAYRLAADEPCVLSIVPRGSIVWVGTERGLYRIDRDVPGVIRYYRSGRVRSVAELPDGTLAVGSEDGLLRLTSRGLERWGGDADGLGRVLAILAEADGSLWLGTSRGLYHLLANGSVRRSETDGRPTVIRRILRTRSGGVWVGAREGLFRLDGNGEPRLACASLANEVVPVVLEDHDGDVWAGTISSGLVRLGKDPVSTLDFGDLLSDQSIWAVEADSRGRVWFGTAKGRFGFLAPGSDSLRVVRQLDAPITAIVEEPSRDALFVSTFGRGAYRFHPSTGAWRRAGGLDDSVFLSLARDGQGGFWAGTITGLKRLASDGTEIETPQARMPSNIVTSVRVDRAGDVWIGFSEQGVARLHAGTLTRFTVKEGLAHNAVIAIAQGSEGEMWIATAGGLTRIRGGVAKSAPGWLVDEIVESLIDDGAGHLWLGTGSGIRRISKAAIDSGRTAAAPGDVLELGHSAGMRNAACSTGNASVVRTRDGRIWFGTQSGLACVDPDHVTLPAVAPQIRIDSLARDGRPFAGAGAGAGWSVPSGPATLAIEYTAPSFRAAENLRFEYRLAGFDTGWVAAGNRRTAYYTNLPPGRYEFQVRVRDGDAPPAGPPARRSLVVEPRWYQTAWFAFGSIAAAGALLLGVHRVRVNHVREELRLKSALERAQLAALREQLRPHFLFNTLNTVLPLIRHAPEAAETVVVELSDLLRATLRTDPSQLVSLEEELRTVRQYFRIAGLRFRERLDVAIQVAPEIHDALVPSFLLQPIAENAIRHGVEATPGRVSVRMAVWGDGSSLTIELSNDAPDPGAGDASPSSRGWGIGLDNTRKRLAWLFGGRARLDFAFSEEDGRATTRIVLPLLFAVPGNGAATREETPERRAV